MVKCPNCEGDLHTALLLYGMLEDCSLCDGDGMVSQHDADRFFKDHPERKNPIVIV